LSLGRISNRRELIARDVADQCASRQRRRGDAVRRNETDGSLASNHCIYSDEAEPYRGRRSGPSPTHYPQCIGPVSNASAATGRSRRSGTPLAVADSVADSSGITPIPVAFGPQRTRPSQRSGAVSIASAATSRSRPSDVPPTVADSWLKTLRTSIRRIGGDEAEAHFGRSCDCRGLISRHAYAGSHRVGNDESQPCFGRPQERRGPVARNVADQYPTRRRRRSGLVFPTQLRPSWIRHWQRGGSVSIASAATSRSRISHVPPTVAGSCRRCCARGASRGQSRSGAEGKIKGWIHVVPMESKRLMKMWIHGHPLKIHSMDNSPIAKAERWIHA